MPKGSSYKNTVFLSEGNKHELQSLLPCCLLLFIMFRMTEPCVEGMPGKMSQGASQVFRMILQTSDELFDRFPLVAGLVDTGK